MRRLARMSAAVSGAVLACLRLNLTARSVCEWSRCLEGVPARVGGGVNFCRTAPRSFLFCAHCCCPPAPRYAVHTHAYVSCC